MASKVKTSSRELLLELKCMLYGKMEYNMLEFQELHSKKLLKLSENNLANCMIHFGGKSEEVKKWMVTGIP